MDNVRSETMSINPASIVTTANESQFASSVTFTSTRHVRVPDPFVDYEGDWKMQLANGFAFVVEEETPLPGYFGWPMCESRRTPGGGHEAS